MSHKNHARVVEARLVSATETMDSLDQTLTIDSTSGVIEITLPPVARCKGRLFYFKRINSGGNNVKIKAGT